MNNIINVIKNNAKFYMILSIIILLGIIGVTFSLIISSFNAIAINTNMLEINADISYDTNSNGEEVVSTGNMLPISDSLVTGPNVTDSRVLKATFNVTGNSNNPENTIYDIALHNINVDCDLRTKDLKWRLYKGNELISREDASLSPAFDTMNNNRLVLTETQEDLTTSTDKYTFLLWISESCTGDITECDSSMDQSKYLGKEFSASIKVELSTKSKKNISRITGSEDSCNYMPVEIPACNTLTYNGSEQILISTDSTNYILENTTGINAGTYKITAKLNDECKWSNGETEDKVLTCNIDKKDVTVATLNQTITYGNNISSSVSNISSSELLTNDVIEEVTLSSDTVDVGTGKININNVKILKGNNIDVTSNYNIIKNNTGIVTINCANIAVEPNVGNVMYTGEELTGVTGGSYITIRGSKVGTEIGSYKATAVPNKNYCWSDGTTEEKEYTWNIEYGEFEVVLDNEEANVVGTEVLYGKKQTGIYLDNNYKNKMSSTSNPIVVPEKTGYTFEGYYTEDKGNGTLVINKDGYLVSDILNTTTVLYAKWAASTNTSYQIQHYQMQLDGTYPLTETENKTGTTNNTLTLSNLAKNYTGFTYIYGQVNGTDVTTTTIAADGSRIIKLYYMRNQYTVTLTKGTGISSISGAGNYYYGASVTIDATASSGYTWSNWSGTHSTTTKKYTFTMPASNVTDTANATINTYTITYNLDGGTVSGNPTSYNVETESFTLKNPTKTGYTFVGWKENQEQISFNSKDSEVTVSNDEITIINSKSGNKFSFSKIQMLGSDWSLVKEISNLASVGNTSGTYYHSQNSGNYILAIKANGSTVDYGIFYNIYLEQGETYTYEYTNTVASTEQYKIKNIRFYKSDSNNTGIPIETISKGSYGNRTYNAKWSANVIHFKYYSNNGTQTNFVNWDAKPTSNWPNNHYNYTNGTYKQSYLGYTGTGYYGTTTTGGTLVGEDESIASYVAMCDKYGVSYYAPETTINIYSQWTKTPYTVSLNKGTGISSVSGAGTYYYGDSVTIDATLSSGYTWSKWSGTHSTTTKKYTFTMPASNVTDTANAVDSTKPNKPTISRTDFNTFSYSATDNVGVTGYYVSKSSTAPTVAATQSTFALNKWTTAKSTGNLSLSAGTYYVWARDAAGNRSDAASIVAYTVTRSVGTGSSLTTRYDSTSSSTGTAFTSNTVVLSGTNVWAQSSAKTGYKSPVLKRGGSTATNPSHAAVTGNVTIASSATIQTYTVSYNANGGSGAPSSQTKTYGQTLKLSTTVPTRTNYTFLGWSTSSSATSATYSAGANYTANSAAKLYAVWKIETVTLYIGATTNMNCRATPSQYGELVLQLSCNNTPTPVEVSAVVTDYYRYYPAGNCYLSDGYLFDEFVGCW